MVISTIIGMGILAGIALGYTFLFLFLVEVSLKFYGRMIDRIIP